MSRRAAKLDEHAVMYDCFLCRCNFQFGPHIYSGKPIRAWGGIMVCKTCLDANADGIVPTTYPHLEAHLKNLGVVSPTNEQGWISIPLR